MLNQRKPQNIVYQWRAKRILKITITLVCLLITSNTGVVPVNNLSLAMAPFADIYVDQQNNSGTEDGSSEHPFRTVSKGIAAVSTDGTIIIRAASYGEKLTINQAMTLRSERGIATIGVGDPLIYKLYIPIIRG